MQMLQEPVGDYSFQHVLTMPGLSEEAALIMHPSQVFNWLGQQARL